MPPPVSPSFAIIPSMTANPPSRVITLIDIGLSADEHYVQFVPPATFGVILERATEKVYQVLANGERCILRSAADKIYTLRGFIGLRRREERDLELGWSSIEDEIIRIVLFSFGSYEKLCTAVWKHCPLKENAEIIRDIWGPAVFIEDIQGKPGHRLYLTLGRGRRYYHEYGRCI
jgi:hypothetical protein